MPTSSLHSYPSPKDFELKLNYMFWENNLFNVECGVDLTSSCAEARANKPKTTKLNKSFITSNRVIYRERE